MIACSIEKTSGTPSKKLFNQQILRSSEAKLECPMRMSSEATSRGVFLKGAHYFFYFFSLFFKNIGIDQVSY